MPFINSSNISFLDDLSSISGSDTEKEETLDTFATAQGKIFFKNDQNVIFSLYKCLVCDRKVGKFLNINPFLFSSIIFVVYVVLYIISIQLMIIPKSHFQFAIFGIYF